MVGSGDRMSDLDPVAGNADHSAEADDVRPDRHRCVPGSFLDHGRRCSRPAVAGGAFLDRILIDRTGRKVYLRTRYSRWRSRSAVQVQRAVVGGRSSFAAGPHRRSPDRRPWWAQVMAATLFEEPGHRLCIVATPSIGERKRAGAGVSSGGLVVGDVGVVAGQGSERGGSGFWSLLVLLLRC